MSNQAKHDNFPLPLAAIPRQPIQIRDIKITRLTYKPNDGSYVHECGPVVLTKYDVAIVEIFTDQGIVGIAPGNVHDTNDYRHLIGKNPFDLLALDLPAGLDVACWDIIGKVLGKPVYQLLATDNVPNPRVPNLHVKVYASGGVNWTYYDKGDGKADGDSCRDNDGQANNEAAYSREEIGNQFHDGTPDFEPLRLIEGMA